MAEHPYTEFEGTALWRELDAQLSKLELNGDVRVSTARSHVIGFLCSELSKSGLLVAAKPRPIV